MPATRQIIMASYRLSFVQFNRISDMTDVLDSPLLHRQYASMTARSSSGISNRTSDFPFAIFSSIKKPRSDGRAVWGGWGGRSCLGFRGTLLLGRGEDVGA